MSATQLQSTAAPYVQQTLDFLDAVFGTYTATPLAFKLWEGTIWEKKGPHPPSFTIVLNHPASLRRMFLPPSDTQLALAYTEADFDITGDAELALNLGKHLWHNWGWRDIIRSAFKLIFLPASSRPTASLVPQLTGILHSQRRDKLAIQYHYDVSNDFYRLWLDQRMVYSCAYFSNPTDSIDVAQLRKLDYICRKLRLNKGDRLLDIGCGWGALVIHAVKHYGVEATGITLSEKQVTLARDLVKEAGVADRCHIELRDYRDVDESRPFDKIVSVGMVEHLGRHNLRPYFDKAYRLLRPGGVLLNHGITLLNDEFKSLRDVKNGFFAKYIFPDGDVQPMTYVVQRAVDSGFEVRDLESLREHYALTLRCWRQRFENHEEEIVDMVGVQSYRLWRLYLLAAGWGFATSLHTIYQALLYKGGKTGNALEDLPLTRDDWYRDPLPTE